MEEIDLNIGIPVIKRVKEKISNEMRELIVSKYTSGERIQDIALMFDFKANTVAKICAKFRKTNLIHKQQTGHRKRKLNDTQRDDILDWIDDNCTLRLKDLKTKLLYKYPEMVSISLNTIDRVFRHFHYSFKRVTLVPERRNSPDVIERRFLYAIEYNQMMQNKDKLVFIDEYGVQINSRSPVGAKAHKTVAAIKGRNYSVCAAMRENSLFMFEIQDKAYNSCDYLGFLTQLFGYLQNERITGAYLVMDNARFHKTVEVMNVIQAHGHIPVFLPPYSPFLNPIEELFSQWKRSIRFQECQSEDELYEVVHQSSEEITDQNCSIYIKHMESYLYKCLNRDAIES